MQEACNFLTYLDHFIFEGKDDMLELLFGGYDDH